MIDGRQILATLTADQQKAVVAEICPYCRAGLPEQYSSPPDPERLGIEHYIPRTQQRFACLADMIRFRFASLANAADRDAPHD